MFIRDLEYCQLEASNNQFDRVNGGGLMESGYGQGKPTKPTKPTKKFPSIAITKVSVGAVTTGGKLAITETAIGAVTAAENNLAFSALELGLSAIAVS